MADIEKTILSNKEVIPNDQLIYSIIGEKSVLWHDLLSQIQNTYNNITGEWRYYNDGKSWLFKLTQKKNTVLWASLLKDAFRVTFYFSDKAELLISNSNLPETIKNDFIHAKRYNKIRGITFKLNTQVDIENALKLAEIKFKIK